MPRTKRLHELKRPKLRQDWSKWNLYNLSRASTPYIGNKTFFQQKWTAKSLLRSFHNPDVREGTWTRMFDRRLPAVVPMDHRYLAQNDGSEMASGRGSGVDKALPSDSDGSGHANGRTTKPQRTPYMHMSFWPLERRLDSAIFRALFASSVRQARQMVVHGFVKVNGKKMIYPGYQLNPGDMFSVDPERVMFSTGAKKHQKDAPGSLRDQLEDKELARSSERSSRRSRADTKAVDEQNQQPPEEGEGARPAETQAVSPTEANAEAEVDEKSDARKALKHLARRARRILDDSSQRPSAKRRQDLRDFSQQVKTSMSKLRGIDETQVEETVEAFEMAFAEILTKLPTESLPKSESAAIESAEQAAQAEAREARKEAELLHAAIEKARANPIDVSKPYATPWRPRDYMSAFAFIPRYLEVNHNICSAVYIRHPVARPGLAEVPTPFSADTLGLGFNWYLRRR